jgi:hypothetical protein
VARNGQAEGMRTSESFPCLFLRSALQNVWKRLDCGENDRTSHGTIRVWPEPGKIPLPEKRVTALSSLYLHSKGINGSAVYLSNYSNRRVK